MDNMLDKLQKLVFRGTGDTLAPSVETLHRYGNLMGVSLFCRYFRRCLSELPELVPFNFLF